MTPEKVEAIDADLVSEGEAVSSYTEAVPQVIFTSDTDLSLDEISIGRLRLAQGTTQEVRDRQAQLGQYVLANYAARDDVLVVPLAAQHIRSYRPDPSLPALCSAPTGDYGRGIPGGVCVECPLSKWTAPSVPGGKNTKPACTEGVAMRAYSLSHREILDYYFMGMSLSKGNFIRSRAMAFGYGNFCIRMTSAPRKGPRGEWFEPVLEMLDDIPEEHREATKVWFTKVMEATVPKAQAALMIGEAPF